MFGSLLSVDKLCLVCLIQGLKTYKKYKNAQPETFQDKVLSSPNAYTLHCGRYHVALCEILDRVFTTRAELIAPFLALFVL